MHFLRIVAGTLTVVPVFALSCVQVANGEPYPLAIPGDPIPEWSINGSISARYDHFAVTGNKANAPFANFGGQYFSDFDFQAKREYSPYHSIEGQIAGTINVSDNRSNFRGIVPERASVTWTNGAVALPYRATAGDFFGFFTPRTINTSLKGGTVDLQPATELFGARHSIQAMAGLRAQTFRDQQSFDDEQHTGVSWLMNWENTAFSVNLNRARIGDDISATNGVEFRTVGSMAGNTKLQFTDTHSLQLDTELAYLATKEGAGNRENGLGGFLEARGNVASSFYRFKAERYTEEFNPRSASIQGNRQTLEAEVGTRFAGGLSVRARLQEIRTNIEGGIENRTRVGGLNVSGGLNKVLGLQAINGSVDTSIQSNTNENNTADTRNFVTNISLNAAINQKTSANANLLIDWRDDRIGANDVLTRQAQLGASRQFDLAGGKGNANLGLTLRDRWVAAGDDFDVGPNVGLSWRKDAHRLQFNANKLFQRPDGANNNVDTTRVSASWDYSEGPHVFRLDASYSGRLPQAAGNTHGYQFGATYTFRFGQVPASRRKTQQQRAQSLTPQDGLEQRIAAAQGARSLRLDAFQLGAALDDAFILMEDAGILGAVPVAGYFVFEEQYFQNISERQRMVLGGTDGGALDVAAVLITPDVARGGAALEQLFVDVRSELIKEYGTPNAFEEGDFSGDAFQKIAAGQIIRIAEWQLPGGTLRLGLPQRNDGQVLLELQYKRSFPSVQDTRWSLDLVP